MRKQPEQISKIHIEENLPEMKKGASSLKGFTVDFVKTDNTFRSTGYEV